jgi:hypothetical protein
MTNKKEVVQELQPQYAIQLTWKSLWIVLTMLITVIGSSFGAGIKVQFEIIKVETFVLPPLTKQQIWILYHRLLIDSETFNNVYKYVL